MAEGARLESVFTGNRNVGSNPTPSASPLQNLVSRRSSPSFNCAELVPVRRSDLCTSTAIVTAPGVLLSGFFSAALYFRRKVRIFATNISEGVLSSTAAPV